MRKQYLIEADELNHLVTNKTCVTIDCGAGLEDHELGFRAYLEGHIPGAVFASLDSDMADPPGTRGRHPLPEQSRFASVLEGLGISNDTDVIAYDDRNAMFACRFWWMVRWLGHSRVRVLNGGIASWIDGGFQISQEIPKPRKGRFEIRPSLTRTVEADEVLTFTGTLLDARAEDRFHGRNESIDHTAGHIPRAISSPFTKNLGGAGKFLENMGRFKHVPKENGIVCYCGSGVSATHNIMALLLAGYDEPALYPGSWSEWIEDPERPVET